MAKFIFDCEDEICLPAAYKMVDGVKVFIEKMKQVETDKVESGETRGAVLKRIMENMMVNYPKDTSELLAKMWVLDKKEKAPNAFKTMATLFSNEVAIDFFTSVLPSLLQLSRTVSPLLTSQK